MEKLKSKKLDGVIKNLKVPLLGICLGLQLLFDYSEESNCAGLGILKGRIKKIPGERLKIPQMGWNSIDITREGMLFKEIKNGSYVYLSIHIILTQRINQSYPLPLSTAPPLTWL